MHVSSVRIGNYKSFWDSGEIPLGRGINVVVGKNDSGKSAFLEALSLGVDPVPHRSIESALTADAVNVPDSTTEITVVFTPDDVQAILRRHAAFVVHAPQGAPANFVQDILNLLENDVELACTWVNGSLRKARFKVQAEYGVASNIPCRNDAAPRGVSLQANAGNGGEPLTKILAAEVRSKIFAFRAERMNVGEGGASGNASIARDAANLADVLNRLISGSRARYDRLLNYLRVIFPHITDVTVPIVQGPSVARVVVWSRPSEEEREDLAVPLIHSGTGIGQVLAILYAVVNAESPRVIIIDEPQSFLHPGAFRKLLEILREGENRKHQYVISSHAPLALIGSADDHVLIARRDRGDAETRIRAIDPEDQVGLRTFLSEVGARLSDVFGADSILWVEGKTEEMCFPPLIRALGETSLQGVQILGVVSTGDLSSRHAERVFDIYTRLSIGNTLMPRALRFVFDREGRSDTDMVDLERKSQGLVMWLGRRMYENYLVEPIVLAKLLTDIDSVGHSVEEVASWLDAHGSDPKYGDPSLQRTSPRWIVEVHGAKLLEDLFAALTSSRFRYDKVNHGLALTQALIDSPTPALKELATTLGRAIASGTCD